MNNETYKQLKKEVQEIKEIPTIFLFLDDIMRFHRKNDKALSEGMITQKQHDRLATIVENEWLSR